MTSFSELSRWIPAKSIRGLGLSECRLFCFPYAGAGASLFRNWREELPASIELVPVQLPGREGRWSEAPYLDLRELARTLALSLRPLLSEPYALFGHSMGGLIAFELACELRRQRVPLPRHLFISGTRAPHVPNRERLLHHLPDALLWKAVMREYGAAGGQTTLNPEMAPVVLPILRADFRMCETYAPSAKQPLPIPFTVYGGRLDRRVTYADLLSWNSYTHRRFRMELFPGGHFFLTRNRSLFLKVISSELAGLVGPKKKFLCAAD